MLISLWSLYIVCVDGQQVDLYIRYISRASGNKSAHWTCGCEGGGSPVSYGDSGVHLEAGGGAFPVEHGDIGVRVSCVPRQRRQIWSTCLFSLLLLFISTFVDCLNMSHLRDLGISLWLNIVDAYRHTLNLILDRCGRGSVLVVPCSSCLLDVLGCSKSMLCVHHSHDWGH
jgi:hypothetical protein